MTAADYIVKCLAAQGVTHVFELSGGMIVPLLDALHRAGTVEVVSCPHEQIAGFAAEGWARMKGIPGVALATSGPGATNLLTAVASCYFDSTPAVFITGNVHSEEMRTQDGPRQYGFQETDIVEMAAPVTKGARQIRDACELPEALAWAFRYAKSGRPGPVLLDFPFDVLVAPVPNEAEALPMQPAIRPGVPHGAVPLILGALAAAERPIILLGGGCEAHIPLARRFVNAVWTPTVHSLMAKDVLSSDHPCNFGLIGSYGARWANWALQNADLVLVLGSRLDTRQIGTNAARFLEGKKVVHIDLDPAVLGCRFRADMQYEADLGAFFEATTQFLSDGVNVLDSAHSAWRAAIAEKRAEWPLAGEQQVDGVHPIYLMREIGRASFDAAAFCVDVGQHQMWAAQALITHQKQRFLTSGGHGAMGFALPAAIGASLACDGAPVVAIMGDGGAQVNLSALHVIAERNLPVKVIIVNNYGHGMVRQMQRQYGKATQSTDLQPPFFASLAQSYRVKSYLALTPREVDDALGTFMWQPGPRLIEVRMSAFAAALPKLPWGKGLAEMEPPR